MSIKRAPRFRVLLLVFAISSAVQYFALCEGYEQVNLVSRDYSRLKYLGYFAGWDDPSVAKATLAASACALLKPLQPVLKAGALRHDSAPSWGASIYVRARLHVLGRLGVSHPHLLFLSWAAINSALWVGAVSLMGMLIVAMGRAVLVQWAPGRLREGPTRTEVGRR